MDDQGTVESSTFLGPRVVHDTNEDNHPTTTTTITTCSTTAITTTTMIQQQLAQRVKHQEWEAVTMLVQSHPELVKVPYHRHGWTLLSWLCSAGGTPATLLDLVASRHPAALRVPDTYLGDTALHLVARHCQWSADKLRSLLPYCCCRCDDGNDTDPVLLRNRLGGTALHAAAHHNSVLDALQALIQHNPAILHVTTHEGIHAVTALWLAYMQTIPGYMTVARILKHEQQQPPPPSNAAAAENPVWDRFWAKVEYLALQSYWSKQNQQQQQHDQQQQSNTNSRRAYVLHGLLLCHVPLNLFQTCLQHAPETASAVDAATGHWPLHVLIAHRPYRLKERDAIVAVLRPARSAASAMDRAGDVPLHQAIRNKIPWHSGVDALVEAAPHTLGYRDRTTRLLPFQLAATQDGRQAVETAFQLLRRQPDLL